MSPAWSDDSHDLDTRQRVVSQQEQQQPDEANSERCKSLSAIPPLPIAAAGSSWIAQNKRSSFRRMMTILRFSELKLMIVKEFSKAAIIQSRLKLKAANVNVIEISNYIPRTIVGDDENEDDYVSSSDISDSSSSSASDNENEIEDNDKLFTDRLTGDDDDRNDANRSNEFDCFYGVVLLASSAKAYREAVGSLRGDDQDNETRREILKQMSHAEHHVFSNAIVLTSPPPLLPPLEVIRKKMTMRMGAQIFFATHLAKLNCHLETRSYLVGHWLTLADIAQAVALLPIYLDETKCSLMLDAKFPHFQRWFMHIVRQPPFACVLDRFLLYL